MHLPERDPNEPFITPRKVFWPTTTLAVAATLGAPCNTDASLTRELIEPSHEIAAPLTQVRPLELSDSGTLNVDAVYAKLPKDQQVDAITGLITDMRKLTERCKGEQTPSIFVKERNGTAEIASGFLCTALPFQECRMAYELKADESAGGIAMIVTCAKPNGTNLTMVVENERFLPDPQKGDVMIHERIIVSTPDGDIVEGLSALSIKAHEATSLLVPPSTMQSLLFPMTFQGEPRNSWQGVNKVFGLTFAPLAIQERQ